MQTMQSLWASHLGGQQGIQTQLDSKVVDDTSWSKVNIIAPSLILRGSILDTLTRKSRPLISTLKVI